ncbi:collagen-like protein [Megavirus courdo7]|uniref:Collagen-like protein n=1 Tax=Megavirus courdo7 TaxID=1128135 RepID=H2EAH2_9VIRU|nr:collagen-like protein [Megavirus courdo7]
MSSTYYNYNDTEIKKYIDDNFNNLYQKFFSQRYVYNIPGKNGSKGESGSKIITDSGNPCNLLGNNGDLYLDVLTKNIYLKKDNIWFLKANIQGNKGERGCYGYRGIKGE